MIADVMAPNRGQTISNHHIGSTMTIWVIMRGIDIMSQLWNNVRERSGGHKSVAFSDIVGFAFSVIMLWSVLPVNKSASTGHEIGYPKFSSTSIWPTNELQLLGSQICHHDGNHSEGHHGDMLNALYTNGWFGTAILRPFSLLRLHYISRQ